MDVKQIHIDKYSEYTNKSRIRSAKLDQAIVKNTIPKIKPKKKKQTHSNPTHGHSISL